MHATGYKKYLLTLLLVILTFNYVDRLALGLLLQDIKIELALSDTELGFLSGLGFAFFYSVMGIPIARWADRGNRVTIITFTTGVWSAAVAMCGAAGSFIQLFLIRILVAVGEAGCIPTAHSLIADHFNREERPRAAAIYMLGGSFSMVVGYFLAGWLNELFGWRMTFLLLGLPGLGFAALAWFTLREPRCSTAKVRSGIVDQSRRPSMSEAPPAMTEVCATLWSNATFRNVLVCFSVTSFFSVGLLQWQPTFFVRSHGLQTGELGTWLALATGLGSILGTYCGGEWASRYAPKNEQLQLKAMSVLICILSILKVSVFLSPNHSLAFGLLGLAAVGNAMTAGPLFGTLQTLVPPSMRAISMALVYLFANLVGMGLGPLAVGVLSDAFQPWAGEDSLRFALMSLCPGYLWAGWHMWKASRTVARDLSVIHGDRDEKVGYQQDPSVSRGVI